MSGSSQFSRQAQVYTRSRVETIPYIGAVRRMIRAAGRRTADGDELELQALVGLREAVELAIRDAAQGQVASGRSWAFVAEGLGTTRQAAFQRYGKAKAS